MKRVGSFHIVLLACAIGATSSCKRDDEAGYGTTEPEGPRVGVTQPTPGISETPTEEQAEARQEAREEQAEARQEAREERAEQREEQQEEKQEARQDSREWLNQAARTEITTVALAGIAQDSATNPAVQRFAEQFVKDHGRLANEMAQAAQRVGVDLEGDLDVALMTISQESRMEAAGTEAQPSGMEGTSPGTGAVTGEQVAQGSRSGERVFEREQGMAITAALDEDDRETIEDLRKTERGKDFDEKFLEKVIEASEEAVDHFEDVGDDLDPQVKQFAQRNLPTLKRHLASAKNLEERGDY